VRAEGDELVVTLRSRRPALFVEVDLSEDDRVFSDNYFALDGREDRAIRCRADGLDAQALERQLRLRSLYDASARRRDARVPGRRLEHGLEATPLIAAMAPAATRALAGSLRSPRQGEDRAVGFQQKAGERQALHELFLLRERAIEGGTEKKKPASTAGSAVEALPSKACICTRRAPRSSACQ